MKRLSALIVLLANIVILAHAAVPHYHGDDMIATFMHIADEDWAAETEDAGHRCHHDGDAPHDSSQAGDHCIMNDTLMASACRPDSMQVYVDLTPAICIIINDIAICDESSATEIERYDAEDCRPERGHCDNAHGLRAPPAVR